MAVGNILQMISSLRGSAALRHKSNVEQNYRHCEQSEAIQNVYTLTKDPSLNFLNTLLIQRVQALRGVVFILQRFIVWFIVNPPKFLKGVIRIRI